MIDQRTALISGGAVRYHFLQHRLYNEVRRSDRNSKYLSDCIIPYYYKKCSSRDTIYEKNIIISSNNQTEKNHHKNKK